MKKGLSNRRGEVFTTTAVKVIIAVVVGVLILGGLFALYRNVIFPKLNQKVEGMIHTEDKLSRACRSRVEIGARQAGSHYREAADR